MVIAAKRITTPETNPAMIDMLSVEVDVDFVELLSEVRKIIVDEVVWDGPGEVSKVFY